MSATSRDYGKPRGTLCEGLSVRKAIGRLIELAVDVAGGPMDRAMDAMGLTAEDMGAKVAVWPHANREGVVESAQAVDFGATIGDAGRKVVMRAPHTEPLVRDPETTVILDPGMIQRWVRGSTEQTLDELRGLLERDGLRKNQIAASALPDAAAVESVMERLEGLRASENRRIHTLVFEQPSRETGSQFSAEIWTS